MKHQDILNTLTALGAPMQAEDRFWFGDVQADVTGVTVAFTGNLDAIEAAKSHGDNLLLIHERMLFPTSYSGADIAHYMSDRINLPRLTALANAGITVLLLREGIESAFQRTAVERRLNLPHAERPEALYDIQPMEAHAAADWAMKALGVDRARLTAPKGKTVRRLAIMNGGEGITRTPECMMRYLTCGADMILCGETDEYPKWAALDCDIALLEVGHTAFDNIGLRLLADQLAGALPDIPVHFHEIHKPWRVCRAGEETRL